MAADQRVLEVEAQINRGAETIPDLPLVTFAPQEQQPRVPFTFNPPFGGEPGIGLTFGGQAVAPSQEVAAQAAGLPMLGPFGVAPEQIQRVVRRCPPTHRLAKDGLCYPKALLAKRSKLRMWPAEAAPPVTRADARALRRHEAVEKKLKRLGKQAGLKVTG